MEKPCILFIPGMMCDERIWQSQIEHFKPQVEVHCADITRHRNMSDIGQTLLQEVPWSSFAIVGLSMGGIVAMELLRQAPQRITHCALLDTNHLSEKPDRQAKRQVEIDQVKAGHLRSLMIEEMKPMYLSPHHSYDKDFLRLIIDMAMALGNQVFINQSIALRDRPDYSATLRATGCPVLLLCGEHDRLCPPSRHQAMQSLIPQAILEVVKGAGHLTPLETPGIVNQALGQWLGLTMSEA